MNELELFGVIFKIGEDGVPTIKVDFNYEIGQYIEIEELTALFQPYEDVINKLAIDVVQKLGTKLEG